MDLFDNHIHISLLALCSSVWWLCCTYWVGGNDLAVEGTFIWTSDNSALGFVNWQPREPDNNKGVDDCVSICSDSNSVGATVIVMILSHTSVKPLYCKQCCWTLRCQVV